MYFVLWIHLLKKKAQIGLSISELHFHIPPFFFFLQCNVCTKNENTSSFSYEKERAKIELYYEKLAKISTRNKHVIDKIVMDSLPWKVVLDRAWWAQNVMKYK